MSGDLINGCFEFIGAGMICLSVRRLMIDQEVKGFSVWPLIFWTSWGTWNLFYYPSLGQWFSFAGGIAVILANVLYLCAIFYFTREERAVERRVNVEASNPRKYMMGLE